MKERPILFKAEMVRAILEGRKTQTRRVVNMNTLKVIPRHKITGDWMWADRKVAGGRPIKGGIYRAGAVVGKATNGEWLGLKPKEFDFVCPGCDGETVLENVGNGNNQWRIIPKPDQRLWVKETFCTLRDTETREDRTYYRATDDIRDIDIVDGDGFTDERKDGTPRSPWKPSLFMPRALSRITLEITGVRVEQVQSISNEDAIAEGIPEDARTYGDNAPIKLYKALWESINGEGSWDVNPWVWVIEFTQLNKGKRDE